MTTTNTTAGTPDTGIAAPGPPADGADGVGRRPVAPEHYADLMEQLFHEYEGILSLSGIVALVTQCRHDLAGSPPTAMPELLERLARYRLSVLADERARGRLMPTDDDHAD